MIMRSAIVLLRMSIYTGRGDAGRTDLRTGERVSKASPRIEAYGTVDELNALIGTIRSAVDGDVARLLERIQNHLHVVQAELANPDPRQADLDNPAEAWDEPRLDDERVDRLETWIDEFEAELEPLTSFILPGGSEVGARLHHARTVCRRAERRVIGLDEAAGVSTTVLEYLNRLSDLLFVLARAVNARAGVPEEQPTY